MAAGLLVAILVTIPATGSTGESGLVFKSERIRLTVEGDSLRVEGLYRFAYPPDSASHVTLFYPFPRDSLLGDARMVSLRGRSPGAPWQILEFTGQRPGGRGVFWRMPLDEGGHYEVDAVYVQELRDRYGRYIVTTTGQWEFPLAEARFEIVLPAGARPEFFSFPFERVEGTDPSVYSFVARDFAPDRDIVFTWKGP